MTSTEKYESLIELLNTVNDSLDSVDNRLIEIIKLVEKFYNLFDDLTVVFMYCIAILGFCFVVWCVYKFFWTVIGFSSC